MKRLIGNFNENNLSIINRNVWYKCPENLVKKIEKAWEKRNQNCSTPLWDGSIYRYATKTKNQNKITLFLEKLKYKVHLSSADIKDDIAKLPFKNRPNGMFVSSYIKTSDEKLILSVKAKRSVLKPNINLIGGNLCPDEVKINSVNDIFNAFMLELKEETSINKNKIISISGIGIYQTDNLRIGVFLGVTVNLTANEFISLALPNFEHKAFLIVTQEELKKMISSKDSGLNPYINSTFNDYLTNSRA